MENIPTKNQNSSMARDITIIILVILLVVALFFGYSKIKALKQENRDQKQQYESELKSYEQQLTKLKLEHELLVFNLDSTVNMGKHLLHLDSLKQQQLDSIASMFTTLTPSQLQEVMILEWRKYEGGKVNR
jgi:predicted histidine transporter YuiF (NhaC family)